LSGLNRGRFIERNFLKKSSDIRDSTGRESEYDNWVVIGVVSTFTNGGSAIPTLSSQESSNTISERLLLTWGSTLMKDSSSLPNQVIS